MTTFTLDLLPVALDLESRAVLKKTVLAHRYLADLPKIYSQDLLHNLFRHPYTKIEYLQNDLRVSRIIVTRYLT